MSPELENLKTRCIVHCKILELLPVTNPPLIRVRASLLVLQRASPLSLLENQDLTTL